MTKLCNSQEWLALEKHAEAIEELVIREQFDIDAKRADKFSIETAGLYYDYSKQKITPETQTLLLKLANVTALKTKIAALFKGEKVNYTEQLPALHTALRQEKGTVLVDGMNIIPEIHAAIDKMAKLADAIHSGVKLGYSGKSIRAVVNIGVGGSDLGPATVYEALVHPQQPIKAYFISNLDSYHCHSILAQLDPESTLFIVASKSYTTIETKKNAQLARQWLLNAGASAEQADLHFYAVTARPKQAIAQGILPDQVLPIWDWVGGRFSVWSAVGLSLVISLGMPVFKELLAGALAMDEHFATAEFANNMPVMMGLISLWCSNFLDTASEAIIPYDQRLTLLPAYLQQLHMESLGKHINRQTEVVEYTTSPALWGGVGTNSQHAFHQLFMQGTHCIPVDFIVALQPGVGAEENHAGVVANCFSQARTLMQGKNEEEVIAALIAKGMTEADAKRVAPYSTILGDNPNSIIALDKLTPYTLGALLALYEHKVYVLAAIWDINAFDQWGVEWGKLLAYDILAKMAGNDQMDNYDASTSRLIERYLQGQAKIKVDLK